MAKDAPTFVDRLRAVGKLDAYRARVDELTMSGEPESRAKMLATRDFCEWAEAGAEKLSLIEETKRVCGKVARVTGASSELPLLPPGEIIDRDDANEADCIRWVANNLGQHSPDLGTCPKASAYGLLRYYRNNPSNEGDFWKSVYVKVLSRSSIESDDGPELVYDGEVQVDFIDKLLKMSEDAQRAVA
jgi:hypothetical protein